MIITASFIVAFFSFLIEAVMAFKIPAWKRLGIRYTIAGVLMSLILSWLIGLLFGASGIIVMMAGLISTGLSYLMYVGMEYVDTHPKEYQKIVDGIKNAYKQILEVTSSLVAIIKVLGFFAKIVLLPITLVKKAVAYVQQVINKFVKPAPTDKEKGVTFQEDIVSQILT